ncbi:hypothetical protein KKF84_01795, partial [Myxococcota bacterium]|nr:hypothetical protein [Myxococcota bacterium]MBU1534018.1 hypothetical protein [Myxococcota bacterium]
INSHRQELQERIYTEAMNQASLSLDYRWGVVVSSTGWHQGIVGIVAAKLAEHFKRPAVVIGIKGDRGRGSVRSHGNINIFKALEKCREHLLTFGGHAGAAGLEIKISEIGNFAKAFDEALSSHQDDDGLIIPIDGLITLDEVSPALLDELEALSPFGNGNPEPVLMSEKVEVVSSRYPRGVHLSLVLRDPVTKLTKRAIGFNMGKLTFETDQELNIIYVPERDNFRGGNSIQLRLLHAWSLNS